MTAFAGRERNARPRRRPVFCFLLALGAVLAGAQGWAAKKPLDHDAYEIWKQIKGQAISADGQWVLYSLAPENGDPQLTVRHAKSERSFQVPQGTAGAFEDNARHVVFTLKPEKAAVRQAKLDEKKKDDQPKDALGILDLNTGDIVRVERVKSFKLPRKASGQVAYLMEKPPAEKDKAKEEGAEEKPEAGKETAQDKKKKKDKEKKEEGTPLVLRNLNTGTEVRFENAVEYVFSEDGRWLAYTASNKEGTADGIFVVDTAGGKAAALLKGKGVYKQPAFDKAGGQFAFVSNRDDIEADQPRFKLYYWRTGATTAAPTVLADEGFKGIPSKWWVSENGDVTFSKKGRRLFFGTAPRPAPEDKEEKPDDEKVVLDVWNWKDPLLQPQQLKQLETEKKRSYRAAVLLTQKNRLVQLADEAVPDVIVGTEGDADVALANSAMPYRQRVSWDSEEFCDVYVIDVNTGARRRVLQELHGKAMLSPQARYLAWWNEDEQAWYGVAVRGGAPVKLSAQIPYRLYDERHDTPDKPNAEGAAGWTRNDAEFLIYDEYDIWAVDPAGARAPRNVTEGAGRAGHLRLRYVPLDPEQTFIDPAAPMLLSAFDTESRQGGFYRARVSGERRPERLIMMERSFSVPQKAERSAELLFTRESFQEFPDLWVAGPDFADARQVSTANPQQADYLWGTAELVSWNSLDGVPLQGLLYKPEGFDPSKRYPMMVNFYERNSDRLYAHSPPATVRSSISTSFYVSRGYLVFVPDVIYREGYPGESALSAVVPGVNSLVARGFVDKDHIGVQGHSWGGYQIAYLVTETNIFAAAEAGAAVANMVSAYGGIRWSTGLSRMFQYEKTQSRIGGTLWQYPLRYIENSPIFHADKIQTPLLMMHNDQDGAVPWYQGIELFTAGRRLGKPMWMLNYNGEDHGLAKYPNKRDFAIRLQQFFDHYLKGAPEPEWMKEGIPAIKKGKTLGLELDSNG